MHRIALAGLLWSNIAAASLTEGERQKVLAAFDPLMQSRAAAEKCLMPDAVTALKFDRNFRSLVMRSLSAIPPARDEKPDEVVVEALKLLGERYESDQERISEIAAEETCLGSRIKDLVQTYRRISRADLLEMPPPFTGRVK